MVGKGEISWKGQFEDGRKRQVYAKHVSKEWRFFEREKRYDRWEPLGHPSLDDWTALLDGIERRVQRRLIPIDEIKRVQGRVKEIFPEAEF